MQTGLGRDRYCQGGVSFPRALRAIGSEFDSGHAIAARQMSAGFGGMLSVFVKGDAEAALTVAKAVKLFILEMPLCGVESLIEHRATVKDPESLVTENLLRSSVGIEDTDDLIPDLEQALEDV